MILLTIGGLSIEKVAIMGVLWVAFIIIFVIMLLKSKKEEKKQNKDNENVPNTPQPGVQLASGGSTPAAAQITNTVNVTIHNSGKTENSLMSDDKSSSQTKPASLKDANVEVNQGAVEPVSSKKTSLQTAEDKANTLPFVPEPVVLDNLESRPLLQTGQVVPQGNYLEVTDTLESTNRVLNLSNEPLPNPLLPENQFIAVTTQEAKQLNMVGKSLGEFVKLTPGTRVEPGYFVEVDLNNKSTEYIIRTDRRLPPTAAKGYRWVRIQTRKLRK